MDYVEDIFSDIEDALGDAHFFLLRAISTHGGDREDIMNALSYFADIDELVQSLKNRIPT